MAGNSETEAIVVFVTAADADEATRLAEMLVEKRLAGCVQIMPPMESIYRWQGEIQRAKEILLVVKTTKTRFDELETQVRAIHSYETPEVVAVPVTDASTPYLKWLLSELTQNS